MHRRDFHYELPPAQIAQHPLPERSASRLLCLTAEGTAHRHFADLPDLLRAGDRLVVNDTRVLPARLQATRDTGGRVELLLERIVADTVFTAQARRALHPGRWLTVDAPGEQPLMVHVHRREGAFWLCEAPIPVEAMLQRYGRVPLPPYLQRDPEAADVDRYQTAFARVAGAVAAPTAGLHFDAGMLARLAAAGIERSAITLHVGAGTFASVRVDDLGAHRMHAERVVVDAATVAAIEATRAAGGRIVAVGTTVVRALESAARDGTLRPFDGETDLFIVPGYRFRVVDALITNFHVPESTLLMLVCAFAGHAATMAAYREAVAAGYRFFSYGDAMWVTRATPQATP